jgi:glycopeptide antibiotics resistance protein
MSGYLLTISIAALCFPAIAAVLSVPYVIWEYRRFGTISLWKTLVVFTFALYLVCAFYLVILPLPADRTVVVAYAATPQLVPLKSLRYAFSVFRRYAELAHPRTWMLGLRQPAVYTQVLNLLMTVPFGFYLRYLKRWHWWQVLAAGFALSLFFELTQLTGLWGIYAHPYRLFDVDDLLVNATGALVGFWLSWPLVQLLPPMDEIDREQALRAEHRTTLTRRLCSFALDWALVGLGVLALRHGAGVLPSRLAALWGELGAVGCAAVLSAVVFLLVPMAFGRTLGQAALRLVIVRPDGSRSRWYQRLVRYLLLVYVSLLLPLFVLDPSAGTLEGVSSGSLSSVVLTYYVLYAVVVLVRDVASASGPSLVLMSDLLSGVRVMGARQAEALVVSRAGEESRR